MELQGIKQELPDDPVELKKLHDVPCPSKTTQANTLTFGMFIVHVHEAFLQLEFVYTLYDPSCNLQPRRSQGC